MINGLVKKYEGAKRRVSYFVKKANSHIKVARMNIRIGTYHYSTLYMSRLMIRDPLFSNKVTIHINTKGRGYGVTEEEKCYLETHKFYHAHSTDGWEIWVLSSN